MRVSDDLALLPVAMGRSAASQETRSGIVTRAMGAVGGHQADPPKVSRLNQEP
jgi:hypothetical protein